MVTFKGEWGKLYHTQHTLLSNVGQLSFLFVVVVVVVEKQTHMHRQVMDQNKWAYQLRCIGFQYSILRRVILI